MILNCFFFLIRLKLQIVERMSNNLTTFIKRDVSPHSRPTFWIILTWQSDAELELAFWSFWESSLVVAKPELWKKEIHMLRKFFHLKWNLYMKKIKPKIRIYLQTDLNFFVKRSSVPFLQKLFSCLFKKEKNVILRGQIFWVMYIESKEKQIKDTEYISFSYNRWSKFIYLCVSLNFYPTKYNPRSLDLVYRWKI